MKSRVAMMLTVAISALAVSPCFTSAQSQQEKQDKGDSILLRASEVLLDVVVRDKKGRIVKDLKQSDFEIYEDNVKQDISSFRLVSRESVATTEARETKRDGLDAAPAASAPAGGREPFSGVNLIAMVFDHLSPNARNLAHKAAMSFIDESLQPDDLVTVCVIDKALGVVQQYTNDKQLLKQAVERATTTAASAIESGAGTRRPLEERAQIYDDRLASTTSAVSGGPGSSGGEAGAVIAAAAVEQTLLNMQVRALETFETLERNQHGQAQMHGLLAVVNSLRDVPGRKAVILFSEGLALPPDVKVHFPAVINAATRANVSIYSVEAGGLRVESGNAEAAREINALANRRMRQNASGREDRSGRPMIMQLERSEDLLKLNPQSGLGELANSTGGFLIADTNDLSVGLRRIDEDLRAHYVLTYVPKNQNLDGRFRQISVKLARSGLEVQTRKGYYALPSMGSSPVLEYEAAALAAMESAPASRAFALRAMAFDFPSAPGAGRTAVLAEVPSSAFTYTPDPDGKSYSADFTIIALVKNESGQVVAKLSRHYVLSGPVEQMEEAKRGEILFYREEQLPPGRYVVETAAYDKPSGKASVQRGSLEVLPSDKSKLRVSSLFILKRAERLTPEEQKKSNPFHYDELVVYPNLGEPIRKAAMKQLPFFFNVYVPEGVKTAPKVGIEVLQRSQRLARLQSELPAPDAAGRIQYASAIPLESFQPGSYELKVTVGEASAAISRSVAFTIAE